MTLNKKHCLLLLVVTLVLLFGASLVSASDTNNTTNVIKDNNKLSSPTNYDGDNMVQSDLTTVKSDANVEKISNTSKHTDTQTTNKKTLNSTTTTDDNIKKNNNDDIKIKLKGDGDLTFTDLANSISQISAGGVLELQNDYKYVESDSDYKNGILISQSITLNGNNHIIDGSNLARIFIISGTNIKVTLNNITFANGNSSGCNYNENGGAIYIYNNNVAINNATFINNSASCDGGAIYWNGNNGNLTNTRFINNTAEGVLNGSNSYIDENTGKTIYTLYGGGGGAVLWTGSNGNITDTYFINNTAYYRGGALLFRPENQHNPCENITIKNSNFTDNIAGTNGGAVDWSEGAYNAIIISSNFTSNVANRSGGAIYFAGHQTNVINSSFYNNIATGVHSEDRLPGGVSTTEIYPVGPGYGGAILWRGEDGLIDNSTFYNNTAAVSGGAVFLIQSNNVTVNNSNFTKNYAHENGGAVDYREGATNGLVINSNFTDNIALRNGGAIYWNGEYGEVINSTFTNNTATGDVKGYTIYTNTTTGETTYRLYGGDGGAILWTGSNGNITDSKFINNTAAYRGGAIFFIRYNPSLECENITIERCDFTENEAGTNGGAVDWNIGAFNGTIISSKFTSNVANRSAGAIYFSGHQTNVINSTFFNNEAKGINDENRLPEGVPTTEIYPLGPGYGGAIVWRGEDGLIDNSTFYNNTAAVSGGAVFLIQSNNVTVNNSNFTKNYAHENGGAVDYREGATNGLVINSNFTDNTALRSGGAVFWNGYNGTIIYSNFVNNTAKGADFNTTGGDGGAALMSGSNGTIYYSNFTDNHAAYRGGAVFFTRTNEDNTENGTVDSCIFTNNTAGLNGGAVDFFNGSVNGYVINSTFEDNFANRSGGAIYWNGFNGHIFDSKFNNNSIDGSVHNDPRINNHTTDYIENHLFKYTIDGGDGGAVNWVGSNGTINNTNFTNNNAKISGGAIFVLRNENLTIDNSFFENNSAINNGGAVMINHSANYTNILNSNFTNNKVVGYNQSGRYYGDGGAIFFGNDSSNGLIDNSIFINNSANANGGAVVWNGEYGNITTSKFYNNTAPYAAGAVRLNGKYLLVNNSLFDGNLDPKGNYSWGSAIYLTGNNSNITNSYFINHYGANTGGAIAIDGSNELLENDTFINNTAYKGGAVFIQKNENVTFNNATFTNNSADFEGGAILINDYANNTEILNSIFTNNKVIGLNKSATNWIGDGGAIYFGKGCSEGLIDNSTFTNNSANANGGAVVWSGDNGNITRSEFYNNTAPYAGGAVRLSGNYLFVNDSLFDSNYDPIGNKSWGSAIYLSGNNSNITNSNFTNNYGANRAGAVYVAGVNATLSYSNFDNNTAFIDGGAILLSGDNGIVSYSNFTKNTAGNNGGAVDIQGAKATISFNLMNNNSADGRGGAVYVKGLNTSIFTGDMNNNSAVIDGGAIYIEGANAIVESTNLTFNHANYGGAVYVNGVNATILSSQMNNNSAITRGGAVDIQGANATISSCQLNNNSVEGDGGAIYINGINSVIGATNLTFNHANYGGAVYVNGVNATILSSQMNNNTANSKGGAVDIQGANATISSSQLNNNSATSEGGAVYITGNNATIEESNLTFNHANYGGALYLTNGNYDTVSNCNFDNNTAVNEGGSIYATSCTNGIIKGSNFTNDYATGSGGSTQWKNSNNISIVNSSYINCTQGGMNSSYGGAVDIDNVNQALVDNCIFINDTTACDGGAINFRNKNSVNSVLSNSLFINCTSKYWNGGAVSWKDKNGLIVNNTFIDCSAISEHGESTQYGSGQAGALLMDESAANNIILNNTFINCTGLHGGAIYYRVNTKNNTHINCTFINNTGIKDGGALSFKGGNETYENCIFINNTSPIGGSIYYIVNNGLIIRDSIFANNTEITEGGFIYVKGNNVSITNTTFYNGSATTGGAISIISGSNLYITNNTFDYNNATTGGALYIASNIQINDTIFTNNIAENGGALYVTKDTTLNNCNLTNNNATSGSAIYVKSGTLTIRDSKLLDNQAHSKEFINMYNRTVGDKIVIGGVFTGLDNYLNGIYWDGGNIVTVNLEYLGVDGITNTDVSSSTIFRTINETYQLIVLEVYDRYNNLIYTDSNYTTANGAYEFSFDAIDDYDYTLYHPEDAYYTYLLYTFNKMVANVTVNVTNITYGESESIKIYVTSNETPKPTGFVTVHVNNTEGYENITFVNIPLDENGMVTIEDAPLDSLNVTNYDVYVRYTGDGDYLSNIVNTTFNVRKADPEIIIDAEDISYGYNETVKINITSNNAKGNITVKIINSSDDILETFEFNLNSTELVVFNLTELLPDTYTINVSYVNDTNYNDCNVTNDFNVIRQIITLNELSDIYVDENQLIRGSVNNGTSLVSEGSVIISLSNGTNISVQLSNGIILEEVHFNKNDTYIVNASYVLFDKIRAVSENREFTVSKIPTITDVHIVNTTIGHVAINVTVQENVEGKYTGHIIEGVVNITIPGVNDGNPVQYPLTGINTTILLDNIEVVGEVEVTVMFNGSYKYINSTDLDFDNIVVEPIASNLTIDISPDNITVGDYVVISGHVYDESGKEITSGIVHITIGTDEYDEEITRNGYLKTYLTTIDGPVNVVVHYNGQKDINDNITILESTNTTEFIVKIKKQETNITIEPLSNIEINKTFNITINLTNSTGSPISDKNIVVLINKVPIENLGKTDENGQLIFEYIVHDSSDILVEAEFVGDDYYIPSENYTLYQGPIAVFNSNISVELNKNPILINETLIISGTLNDTFTNETYPDEFTHPIEGATVIIKVNNEVIGSNITDSNGAYSYEINVNNHPELLTYSSDAYIITVEYSGEPKIILGSAAGTIYNVEKIPTNTNVTILNNTYGNVTIMFNVTEARNPEEFVTEGLVYIYDFISGNYTSYLYVPGGNIEYKLNYDTTEPLKLIISYSGTDKYNESNARNESAFALDKDVIVIDIQKAPSITNIEGILSNKSSNVTLAINVTNDTQDLIPTGHVIVFNATDGTILGEGDLTNGKVNITLTNVTEPGDIEVNVTYQGNNKYLPSNAAGLNAPEDKFNTTVITVTVDPEITIGLNKTEIYVGESVKISGILYNETGELHKADAIINVCINGTEHEATFDSTTGIYYIDYTPEYNGTILINASYIKDDEVVVTSQTIELIVNKMPTFISITPISDVEVNKTFTIEVTLRNETLEPISGKNVIITVNNVELTGVGQTDENGKTNITYTPHDNTALEIKAIYEGNEVYLASENLTNLNVSLSQSIVTVHVNKTALYAGESVNITGKVLDGQGNELVDATVTLYLNGNRLTSVLTDNNGEYSHPIYHLLEGEYIVRAEYDGIVNAIIGDDDTTYYSVHKMPTTLDLNVLGESEVFVPMTIEVTLNNSTENTNGISDKQVIITVNDVPIKSIPLTDYEGKISVTYTPQDNSTLVIKAVFAGDDYYVDSSDTETINNITLSQSTITVDVNKSALYAGESVNITGKLTDGQNNNIVDAIVKLYINDTFEAIVLTNSTGEYTYSINNLAKGEYTVKAVYGGVNNTIIGDDDTEDYVVEKMNTTLTLTVPETATVNVPITIEVNLNNRTDNTNPISGKPIVITVNDIPISNVPLTDADGHVVVNYTPKNNTTLVIKAVFAEDNYYNGSEDTKTIVSQNITLSQSSINVSVNKSALYAGESVNITGRLVDGLDNIITGADVKIYINDELQSTVQTNLTGEYSYSIDNLLKGEYNVKVVYDGVESVINGSNNSTAYSVEKMATNITVVVPENVEVLKAFDIEVTLRNNTDNTNGIKDKPITITVNGINITDVPLTDQDGKIIVSYTPQDNSTLVIKAVFDEDDYYLEDSDIQTIASENISLSKSTITVNVNESNLYVDESVNITGRLIDGLNNAIPNANVNIYINEQLKGTAITDSDGEYSYIINNLNKGNYDVLVVYDGVENVITSSNDTTVYNVSKIPTITNVTVINNTIGNVTIDVIVTENLTGRHTDVIYAGALEVTVNGKTQQYPVKGHNSTITLDGKAFINTTDEVTFNVKYIENDKYLESDGLNASTGEEITVFTADSQQSSITVIVTPESQTINDNVVISGHVYDGMGTEITSGSVYLTINDNAPVEVNLTNDGYSHEYKTDIVGLNNVTAVFEDVLTENSNILIKSSTNNTTFIVDKIKTTTTVEILNNTVGNVTIDIKVVGADGNTTITGDVNITIAGKTSTVSLIDGEENLTVKLSSVTQVGDIQVSVEYLGNYYYESSIANNTEDNKQLTNITVEKQTANITLDTNVTECYIGEYVNIFGNLTDGMGQRIINDYMTLTVDGKEFIIKTNSTGGYTLDYLTDRLGEIVVNASYVSENYNEVSANKTFNVTKIPTKTSVDILNTTLSNVTVEVSVVDVYDNPVSGTIKVHNATDYTHVLTEATIENGLVNITIPSENIGSLNVIIEYQENDIYLASNATNSSLSDDDPYKNITQIDVTRIPTITSVEILNTTLSNVIIKVTVVNQTSESVTKGSISILDEEGNVIADLSDITLDDGQAIITLPFDEAKDYKVIVHYNENDVYMASNATNESAAGTADENITIITVTKIPTKTNVTILDTTFNNVTIAVNVTNMTDSNVEEGSITIFDRQGNVLVDNYPLTNGLANITIPVEATGELLVIVHYNENDVYLPSNATNSSSIGALEEITFINVTKIPTITNVEIISNLINNVTIGVNVTNTSTGELVEKGQVAVYDTEGNELVRSDLTDGKATIIIPRSTDGIFEVVVKYIENDIYYNSTAINETAEAGRENITVIDVTKIATITNVEVLNNTIGNVSVHISTTNMTGDAVDKGHVVVRDQNNNIIGEGDLINGGINLTLNVTTPTTIGINVTYLENDLYLSSNAKNNTLPPGSSDENITYIDVAKQNATITINTNKDVVVIGEEVTIYGTVTDGMGIPITSGIVNISINGTLYSTELKDGIYSLNNITIAAGVYTVNATYTGNDNISSKLSDNVEFTVNKMPTITTVEILNNTAGNVTVEVTVTNMTGDFVKTGEVVIKDAQGIITTENITDGKAILVIPTENTDTLYVNVSYIENTHYYSSNAINSSSTSPEYENITVIDLVKQNASISIEIVNPSVIMGDVVTIRGQVTDGMGNIVDSGDVDVCVDGIIIHTTIVDEYYTVENQTFTAGVYDVNATYLGNDIIASVTSETVNFTVNKMPTVTVVEVLNNTAGNVTIDIIVTNSTGLIVTEGQFNINVAGKNITVDVAGINTTVKLDINDAGDVACYVDYLENDNYTSSSANDKDSEDIFSNITVVLQNATITLNATPNNAIVYQDVTINGTLIDGMNKPIANEFVEIIVNNTSYYTKTDADGVYSIIYTPIYNGTVNVTAIYDGNTRVNAINTSTTFTVDKIETITKVEIINTTLSNVTIRVNVTNSTDDLVTKGSITVYDTESRELTRANLTDGMVEILIPCDSIGSLEIIVKYDENDLYLNSTALNDTASPGRENITLINVTRIPTITNVEILDNVAGNVTLAVNVTNMTGEPVSKGEVYVHNATNYEQILATGTLTDGSAIIKLDSIIESGPIEVIVEYQENDIYFASNATNSSATGEDVNIIKIDVQKQSVTITIELSDTSIIISENTIISGQVFDGMGEVVKSGNVTIYVIGDETTTEKTVEIIDDEYSIKYTGLIAGNYTVKAKYLGNSSMTPVISEELTFVVNKIPTVTIVTIINTTVGNVTIGVEVTNKTDDDVIKGNVTIYDMNGNILVNKTLTDKVTNITIPTEHSGPLSVIVTYEENDLYQASNATNSSASGTPSEQITTIDVVPQNATVTMNIDKDNVTLGDKITINGTVLDGMGNPVTEGNVTIEIDGDKYTVDVIDGKYSLENITSKAGNITINATYNGKDGVINPETGMNKEITVNKKSASVDVVQVGNTPGNTTLEVTVTDVDGNPINEGNVVVTLPDGTNITVPVVDGTATVPINTTPGDMDVNITYNGTDVYDKETTNTTISTVKLNTTIPIDKISNVTIGDKVTISGNLTDQNGVDIVNATIIITINGNKYNTTTNKAGEYTFTYNTTTSGINNVTVEYDGNTIYNPTNNLTNFTVNKKNIVMDVKQTSDIAGNTTLEVKVTDDEGRPVKNGSVIVTLPDGTNTTVPVVNGTAVVTLDVAPGEIDVNITYNGTGEYDKETTNATITVAKINTTIPIDTIEEVSVGDIVNITGTLLDSNNNAIPDAIITVIVNDESQTTTTNNVGEYNVPYTTSIGGINNVTVKYDGNKTYNPTSNNTTFIVKVNATIESTQTGSLVGNTTINVNITDENGNKIPNGTVTVKDKDGNVIGTGIIKNGTANIILNVPAGEQNITITYNGDELVNPASITQSITVNKNNAIITINPINNITLYQTTQITGKLTDINGNPIANANVTIKIDKVTKTVTTDRYGDYSLVFNTTKVGLNNVTATFDGDNTYNSDTANATFNASKIITYITVADVNGTIGENITLTATVTDEYGTKVTGGKFLFKVNGLTLRTNGKFDKTGTAWVLSPVNGTVTVTVVADIYLRNAKNITGTYGETSKYYGSRSTVPGIAILDKRDAQITVTTVKTTKQDVNMTLTAVVTDVTHGKDNGPVIDYEDNFVTFKVNGLTIKNEDGSTKQAKVVNGVATMDYYVPIGLAGTYANLTNKTYTVTATFGSESYNTGVVNNTTFGVEKSPVSFINSNVTLNSKTKEMSIKADIVDYHENILKGTNTVCLKINGLTYKINNKAVYYKVQDGKVDLNIILPYNVNKVNSVELVTRERVGYLGGRTTINNITLV